MYSIALYFPSRGVNTAGRDHMLLIEVQSVVDKTDHGLCTHIFHNKGKYVTILSSKSH